MIVHMMKSMRVGALEALFRKVLKVLTTAKQVLWTVLLGLCKILRVIKKKNYKLLKAKKGPKHWMSKTRVLMLIY